MSPVTLAIDFAPVSYTINAHHADIIGNLVDDAVIANTNAPVVIGSSQLSAT